MKLLELRISLACLGSRCLANLSAGLKFPRSGQSCEGTGRVYLLGACRAGSCLGSLRTRMHRRFYELILKSRFGSAGLRSLLIGLGVSLSLV